MVFSQSSEEGERWEQAVYQEVVHEMVVGTASVERLLEESGGDTLVREGHYSRGVT